jgi:hypothetical protein
MQAQQVKRTAAEMIALYVSGGRRRNFAKIAYNFALNGGGIAVEERPSPS